MPVIKGLCKNVNHFCTAFFLYVYLNSIEALSHSTKYHRGERFLDSSSLFSCTVRPIPPLPSARNDIGAGTYWCQYFICNSCKASCRHGGGRFLDSSSLSSCTVLSIPTLSSTRNDSGAGKYRCQYFIGNSYEASCNHGDKGIWALWHL